MKGGEIMDDLSRIERAYGSVAEYNRCMDEYDEEDLCERARFYEGYDESEEQAVAEQVFEIIHKYWSSLFKQWKEDIVYTCDNKEDAELIADKLNISADKMNEIYEVREQQ